VRPLAVVVVIAWLCVLAVESRAAWVTWTIEGTTHNVADPEGTLASLGLVNGAPYTYSITFESSTPGFDWGDGAYTFYGAVRALSFTSGAFALSLPAGQSEGMGSFANRFGASGVVALEMIDTEPAVTLGLPIAPPVYSGTQISLTYGNPFSGTGFLMYAGASQMSYSVPEPANALLALSAASALAWARRRARSTGAPPSARPS
jgi:hypothetical protein